MVPFSCLWQEALSSDFSPTLCWMVFAELWPTSRDQRARELLSPGAGEAWHIDWKPFGHHFVEGPVLQDASTACSAAFIGVFWGPGRRFGPSIGARPILMAVAFARLLMRLMTPLSRSPSWEASLLSNQAQFVPTPGLNGGCALFSYRSK